MRRVALMALVLLAARAASPFEEHSMPQAMPRREFLGVSASAALSAALFPHSLHRVGPPATKPSFVFILIDDMGWADVGCNGSSLERFPLACRSPG